jgi:regulator of protease activity HflC (stomatin/prohibitin superfamily)
MTVLLGILIAFGFLLAILLAAAIRILREYERGVVFRLGRLIGEKGPGLILLIPIIDRMVRVDLRTVTLNIPPQKVITRDNVPASVNTVCYFHVISANQSNVAVENYLQATSQISQTTLRSVLGKADLDTLLAERERLNENLQRIIDEQTEPWGVKVTTVEIKDVEIPQAMQRAMARQAEAERGRRGRSSTPRVSSRPPSSSSTRPRSSRATPPPCSFATSRPCSSWASTRTRRSSSHFRST